MSVTWRAARTIRIHCPIAQQTFNECLSGNLCALESDPAAAKLLAVIRALNPLGDFDVYHGVFEVAFGVEGFTPTPRAQPAVGERGTANLSPTAIITTYVDESADDDAVSAALNELVRAHPWETPVIEVAEGIVLLPERTMREP